MRSGTLSRALVEALLKDLEQSLKEVAARHGVLLIRKSASWSPTTGKIGIEICTVADDGTVQTREAEDFRRHAAQFGLLPSDLGRTFALSHPDLPKESFRITGLRLKRVNVVEARDESGRLVALPADLVRSALQSTSDAASVSIVAGLRASAPCFRAGRSGPGDDGGFHFRHIANYLASYDPASDRMIEGDFASCSVDEVVAEYREEFFFNRGTIETEILALGEKVPNSKALIERLRQSVRAILPPRQ